jgi:hypothetical protein
MGDRGNIAIKQETKDKADEPVYIYFYSHWTGSALPLILQKALERGRGRWGDESYLNRIIFSEMIQDDVMAETGYGISTSLGDGGHAIVYVDHDEMTVTIDDKSWSFEEYLKADLESLAE